VILWGDLASLFDLTRLLAHGSWRRVSVLLILPGWLTVGEDGKADHIGFEQVGPWQTASDTMTA